VEPVQPVETTDQIQYLFIQQLVVVKWLLAVLLFQVVLAVEGAI
jgi:hypothetical protein